MSIYVYRFIEVKRKDIEASFSSIDELPSDLKNGKIYSAWEKGHQHYIKIIGHKDGDNSNVYDYQELKYDEIPIVWTLAKWWSPSKYGYYSNKPDSEINGEKVILNDCICDNCIVIRDNYLRDDYYDASFNDRGYPQDMSDELKKALEKYGNYSWGHTYVYMNEWYAEKQKRFENFKNKYIELISKKEFKNINDKLDLLLKKVKDPLYEIKDIESIKNDDNDEDVVNIDDEITYLFDETYQEYQSICSELSYISCLVDEIYGFTLSENVRITYFCA